jgi:hypothetical protein
MHCAEFDLIVCDYVDGTLSSAERRACDQHLAGCAGCRELVAEQRAVLSFLEGVPAVEPPQELITRLVQDSPLHKQAAKQAKRGWFRRLIAPLIDPILQPRFAMGMAMTILSFSMLGKFAAPVKQLKPSDLDPVKVWTAMEDKAHRTWERGVKYYDNLRLVWEVRSRLAEIEKSESEQGGAQGQSGKTATPPASGQTEEGPVGTRGKKR